MDVGTEVWVKSDAHVWEPGVVLDCQAVGATGVVKVRLEPSGEVVTSVYAREDATENELYIRNAERSVDALACLTELEHLHEPALLHALSERFAHDEIYTSIGDILVAVNPLKPLELYAPATIDRYKDAMYRAGDAAAADRARSSSTSAALGGDIGMLLLDSTDDDATTSQTPPPPPHVFTIGAKAFGGLLKPAQRNQSILVSGESGSGKTETTKFLMQFLTSVGRDPLAASEHSAASDVVEVGRRILQTNPILESFGNAQTIRNDNSSRFGKFIKIQFGQRNEIVGAEIASYLLEKVRLIHQSPGERNFHIFYELLEGASASQLEALGLARGAKYELLNAYGNGPMNRRATLGAQQLARRFAQTVQAFDDTGVDRTEQALLFDILAALLHLGNVNFMSEVHEGRSDSSLREESAAVTAATRHHFDKCAALLGVTTHDLESLLLTRMITAGSDVMVLKQTAEQAKDISRSLAKAIYGRAFSWLVRRLSDGINYCGGDDDGGGGGSSAYDYDAPAVKTIGILDIFGFESLDRNGFEQLCINYANERLQAQFNAFVFVKEQDVYSREGIDWRAIPYPSNDACLALFDDKASGLFSLLDQECLMPKGSDDALATKFYRYHGDAATATAPATQTASSLLKHQHSNSNLSATATAYTLPQLVTSFGRYLQAAPADQIEKEPEPPSAGSKAKPFFASKMDRVKHQFVVHHFAGRVCYRLEQFVEKNLDMLPADVSTVFHASSNAIVRAIADVEVLDQAAVASNTSERAPGRRRYSLLRAPSVSAQFKTQLDRLVDEIGWTEAHYIRCLKPNELKRAGIFDRHRMVEQLRSVGVLEALRIARAGYSVRLAHTSFSDLFATFRSLLPPRIATARRAPRAYCEALVAVLVRELELERSDSTGAVEPPAAATTSSIFGAADSTVSDSDDAAAQARRAGVQVGRTLVFCKNETFNALSRLRLARRDRSAIVLQRYYRGYRNRRRFQQLRAFALRIQSIVRGFLARKHVRELRRLRQLRAVNTIQCAWRCKLARMREQRRVQQLHAAIVIQCVWRGKLARMRAVDAAVQRFQLRVAFRRFQRALEQLRESVRKSEALASVVSSSDNVVVDGVVVVDESDGCGDSVASGVDADSMVPQIAVTVAPPLTLLDETTNTPSTSASASTDSKRSESDDDENDAEKPVPTEATTKKPKKSKTKDASASTTTTSTRRDKHHSNKRSGAASASESSSSSEAASRSSNAAPRKHKASLSSSSRHEKRRSSKRVEVSASDSSSSSSASSSSDDTRRNNKKAKHKRKAASRSSRRRRGSRAASSESESESDSESSSSSSDDVRRSSKKSSSRYDRQRTHAKASKKKKKRERRGSSDDNARNKQLEHEILRLKQMLVAKHNPRASKRAAPAASVASVSSSRSSAARFGIDELYHVDPLDVQARAGRRSLSLDELEFSADEAEAGDEVSLLPPRRAQSVLYHARQLDHVSLLSRKIEELDAKCKFLEQLVARKSFDESSRSSVAYSFRSSGSGGATGWDRDRDRRRYPSVIDDIGSSVSGGGGYGDGPSSEHGEMDGMIRSIQQQMDALRQSMATKEEALQSRREHPSTSISSSRRTRSSSVASSGSLSGLLGDPTLPHHQHHSHHHSHLYSSGNGNGSSSNALLSPSESHRKQLSSAGSGYSGAGSLGYPATPTSSLLLPNQQQQQSQPLSSEPSRMNSASSISVGSMSNGNGSGGRHVPRIVKWARSNQCFECDEPFNLFVRRHHCRMCGNSFCHEHSSRRVTLSGIGFDDEPVRVCDPCFADHYAYAAQGSYPTGAAAQFAAFPSYGGGTSMSMLAASHASAA